MASPGILVPNAHLIGLLLQMLATGAYFIYLPQCIVILRKKLRQGLSIWLPIACALMCITTTIDLIVEIWRGYHAFSVKGKMLPNPSLFYADPATPESLVKNALNVIVALISDAIITYRTFIIWDMSIAVILIPTGAILANIAIGIWAMWTLSRTRPGDLLVLADVTVRIRYFFILTFCVNMLCASLICFKIWRVHVLAKRVVDMSATKNVLEIVIESAALYCAYLFALIVTSSVGSNAFFVFLDPLPPVTAVIFSMLIVRAQTTPKEPSTAQRSSIHFWSRSYGPGLSTVARRSDGSLADAEINVNLQHTTDSVTDSTVVDSTSRIGYHPGERGSSSREYELSKMA